MDRADDKLAEPPFRGELFRIEATIGEPRNLLVLAGQIDLDVAGQLRDEAERLAAAARDVEIDWRDLESVTGSSLQVLLALGVSLSDQGQTLRVIEDNPKVRRWLELAGLSSRFPTAELTAGAPAR